MATKTVSWGTGNGSITLTYTGTGNGTITVSADSNNLHSSREQTITLATVDGSKSATITVRQAAKPYISLDNAVVTAADQTYSGSAKTPTPTVTLDGVVIESSNYDVTYDNNTNAGTATVTITGKGDYNGSASGEFTIAKADPTYTAPTAKTLTYNGSSQSLVNAGANTTAGTFYYTKDGLSSGVSVPSATTAGTYSVGWEFTPTDTTNYNSKSGTISVTINKASRTLEFSPNYAVVDQSGTLEKAPKVSAGVGDGDITYSISSTKCATIDSSTGRVYAKTSDGSATVTATITEGTNYLSASASYKLYVFATIHNFSYTGSVQSITLPLGTYKLQCWGAQGGSANGISGGKGGYSVGQLTISSPTKIYVCVGGAGTSSSGGYNGGGDTTGYSEYDADNDYGYSYMGGGGGATDINIENWSRGRMIVAGGGAGGAWCGRELTTETTSEVYDAEGLNSWSYNYFANHYITGDTDLPCTPGTTYYISGSTGNSSHLPCIRWRDSSGNSISSSYDTWSATAPSGAAYMQIWVWDGDYQQGNPSYTPNLSVYHNETTSSTSYTTDFCVGGVGGGTTGGGLYPGEQNRQPWQNGNSQTATNYRYCSGASGGGWYGGGGPFYTNNAVGMYGNIRGSGGGSGFVNTAENASYRPSNYNGLQLDSGSTYAGDTTFESVLGATETGHADNGYARITRIS